jgi:hypothetical protein
MSPIALRSLALAALLAAPGLALADDPLMSDKINGSSNEPATIYLGDIAVGGQRQIYEAMQDIKLALEQPLSTDPKLANVVVCRIADDIGSHAKQLLICGTNAVLNKNKEILQTTMSNSLNDTDQPLGGDAHGGSSSACSNIGCYEDTLSILNESLSKTRKHYMKQQVNGASLHALLAKIPYPKQVQAIPASTTVQAPAVVTSHV